MGTLLGNLGTLLENLLLGTLAWEPVPWNLLGTLLGNLFLGTLLGNLAWEPLPGNLATSAVRIWLLRGILLEKETLPRNPVPNLAPCGFGCSDLLRNLYYG